VGQFFDVVYQTVQLPLCVDLVAPAQRDAIESLVGADVREHRFHGGEALRILRATLGRVDPCAHLCAMIHALGAHAPAKERHVAHRRGVAGAEACGAEGARPAVALRATKVFPDVIACDVASALTVERLSCGTHTRVGDRIIGEGADWNTAIGLRAGRDLSCRGFGNAA
jgi:hypothetical protein